MIQLRLLYHYPAASWVSPLPTLGVEICARQEAVKTLMGSRDLLASIAESVPGFKVAPLVAAEASEASKSPERWFALWLDVLLTTAGIPQVLPPEALSHQAADTDDYWRAELRCPCQSSDSGMVPALLRWSLDCWLACHS